MQQSLEATSITGEQIMVELIDLVGPVLIFLFQTAFLKILISLLVSLTVILTVKDGFISIV